MSAHRFLLPAALFLASQTFAQTALPLFGLQPGTTTYPQAQLLWQQQQAHVDGEYYGNAQEGFLAARPENIPNKRVVRTHLSGLTLDGARTLQLHFFDDMLYQLSADYPADQGAPLAAQLSRRYGAPLPGGSPTVQQWQLGPLTLSLRQQLTGTHTLTWQHAALERQVSRSNTEIYAARIRQALPGTLPR